MMEQLEFSQEPAEPKAAGFFLVKKNKSVALHPEGREIIQSTPGGRPMFLKAKLLKESRNGFKTINYRRYSVMISSKN